MSKRNNNAKNVLSNNFLKMQIISFIIFLLSFIIFGFVSVCFDIGIEYMLYIALAFVGISSFLSGAIAGLKERKNGMICGVVNALPCNLILVIASLVLNGFKADFYLLFTLLTGLLSAAAGGITAVNIRLK